MTDRLMSLLHSRPPVLVVLFLAVAILFFARSVSFWSAGAGNTALLGVTGALVSVAIVLLFALSFSNRR